MNFFRGFKEALLIKIDLEEFGFVFGGLVVGVGMLFALACFLYAIKEILEVLCY